MNENKIPKAPSLEEQIETLKASLSYYQNEEIRWKRETKNKAFRMAIDMKHTTVENDYGKTVAIKYSVEEFIKDANKIYEELIK